MTTPPLDLPALREAAEEVAQHEPDFLDIHDYLSALADMQQLLSGRTVLALIARAEAAEAKVAAVRELLVSCASYDVNHSGEVVEAQIVRDALDATP